MLTLPLPEVVQVLLVSYDVYLEMWGQSWRAVVNRSISSQDLAMQRSLELLHLRHAERAVRESTWCSVLRVIFAFFVALASLRSSRPKAASTCERWGAWLHTGRSDAVTSAVQWPSAAEVSCSCAAITILVSRWAARTVRSRDWNRLRDIIRPEVIDHDASNLWTVFARQGAPS